MTMKPSKLFMAIKFASIVGVSITGSAYTFAQSEETKEIEEVVVTGSLIRNPKLERSAPVNVISAEEMEYQAVNVVEEMLREVPGAVPSIGANVNNGNAGFSYVDLRGLGANRNVVVVDGRRMSPSEMEGRFDLNNIPVALIERVDVLTGGASTTYGADAIAGVVNFVTKKDFTGAEFNTNIGSTERGDGDKRSFDLTLGADLDGGRGNAVLSIGYQESDPVFQSDRDFSQQVLIYANGSRGGSGLGSFNSRFGNVNPTGTDHFSSEAEGHVPANMLGGVQDDRTFASAYTPFNYGPSNAYQTPFERYNLYSSVNYEITDSVEAYAKAIYSQNVVNTLIAPSGSFGTEAVIALNHPLMSDAQRNAFCAFDTNSEEGTYTPRYTQAQCDAAGEATGPNDPNYLTVRSQLNRRNVEGGKRISDFTAHYFNYNLGLRGDLNESISWDLFASYGKSDQTQVQKGYWMNSRIRQSLLSGPNGCNDTGDGCVPIDFFGPTGSITPEMNAFLQGGESRIQVQFDMTMLSASLAGELGFSSPWADDDINFALALESRDYNGSQESDLLSQSGDLGGGTTTPNVTGGYSVRELIAETAIPLIQDAPLAEEITAEFGARYSDYSIDADGVDGFSTTTWKTGMSWTPIEDIKVRASFAHAVRAPNLEELFQPPTPDLENVSSEPCSSVNDNGESNGNVPTGALRDVCIAQGAPAGTIGSIPHPAAGQVNVTKIGNVNLQPEKSDSLTVGFVFQPSFLPDFSATLDYYKIDIEDAITEPTPGDVLAACFDNPSTDNPACTSIVRSSINGSLSGDSSVVSGLPQPKTNLGKLATDGIDLSIDYQQEFGNILWNTSFVANKTFSSTFQATPTSINRECVGLYSGNCESIQPEETFNWRNTLSYSSLDVSLMWRFISNNRYEDAVTAGEPVAFVGVLPEDPQLGAQDFNSTGSYNIFDLTLRYNVSENITVTSVVSNLFDREPPLTGSFIGATGYNSGNTYPSTFDTLGRRWSLAAKMTF